MSTLQPIMHELLLGGSWTDVTDSVERDEGNAIRIQRRPLTWGSNANGTNATWTYKNPDGDFYGRNPNSQYFGLLGRNTQTRTRLRFIYDDFTRSVSNALGTEPTTGLAWTSAGGAASDRTATGSEAQIVLNTLNTSYRETVAVTALSPHIRTLFKFNAVPTGAAVSGGLLARYIDSNNYYFTRILLGTDASVTVEIAKRVAGTNTTLSSVVTGLVYTANLQLAHDFSIEGNYLRARIWRATDEDPTTWQAVYLDADPLTTAGGVGLRSQANTGNTNTTPTIKYDKFDYSSYRFWGEIPSFTPERDKTGNLKNVPITAAGLAQRLGSGETDNTLRSALTRTLDGIGGGVVPAVQWPMEESTGATRLGNLRDGTFATVSGAVSLASYAGAAGSASVPVLSDTGQIAGTFPAADILSDASGRSSWTAQFMATIPSTLSANTSFFDINISDTGGDHAVKLRVEWTNATKLLTMRPYNTSGAGLTGISITLTSAWYDIPLLVNMSLSQSSLGGTVNAAFGIYVPDGTSNTVTGVLGAGSTTIMPVPQSWRAYGNSVNTGWSFSHLTYYTDSALIDDPNQANNANAIDGFTGEKSGTRQIRLSDEEGIAFELIGDAADTNECGPQQVASYLDLMKQASDVEQGILFEARDSLSLRAYTRTALLNTPVVVEYSYSGSSDMESMQVVDDGKTIRNKITASRIGGSFATAEITSGPASTLPPPDGIGVVPENLSWNLATDDQLIPFAGWRALVKGWDAARYPASAVWRDRSEVATVPALDAAVLAMDIGTHYAIVDLPDDLPPEDVGLLLQGYDETLANFEHRMTFDGTASGPYDTIELDDATLGRVGGDHSLLSAVNTTATTWSMVNTDPFSQLVTDGAQAGWSWLMAGELVTVSGVTAPDIAFRGVGTADSGSSGSRHPGLPTGVQVGDLVFIFASTRNSGTGVPQLLIGWDQIYLAGNIAVYAAIYNGLGGAFMPTVTFSGGAVNEDTIAQSAAFSGKFNDTDNIILRICGCDNVSAQDITVPGMPVAGLPENCAALYIGWKQDDFTSVAEPASWHELQEASSTAGNDASQVWGYRLFTAKPTAGQLSPSLVVTGGASAISRGAVILFASDYQNVTVVRSENGVVKSHVAGEVPTLVPTPHVAL
jgi:hypothetical protein